MINSNTANSDDASIDYIDLISEEEESEIMPDKRKRQINKSFIINNQSSQNSLNYNYDEKEYESTNSNDSFFSDRSNTNNPWTEDHSIRLIYIVNKVGRRWKMIADRYKSYFANIDDKLLSQKYWSLKQNKIQYKKLKEKAKLVNNIEIDKRPYERKETIKWSNREMTYLVLGFMKYGNVSNNLKEDFKKYFHESRSLNDLAVRYGRIKKDTRKLKYFQQKALLLLKKNS
jgi:hypothetical protein